MRRVAEAPVRNNYSLGHTCAIVVHIGSAKTQSIPTHHDYSWSSQYYSEAQPDCFKVGEIDSTAHAKASLQNQSRTLRRLLFLFVTLTLLHCGFCGVFGRRGLGLLDLFRVRHRVLFLVERRVLLHTILHRRELVVALAAFLFARAGNHKLWLLINRSR